MQLGEGHLINIYRVVRKGHTGFKRNLVIIIRGTVLRRLGGVHPLSEVARELNQLEDLLRDLLVLTHRVDIGASDVDQQLDLKLVNYESPTNF